jgi:hypothetical protein
VAHVTGTVALMLAHHPRLDAARIFELLDRTSSPLIATDSSASRSINACAALASIEESRRGGPRASDRCGSTSPAQTARAAASRRY